MSIWPSEIKLNPKKCVPPIFFSPKIWEKIIVGRRIICRSGINFRASRWFDSSISGRYPRITRNENKIEWKSSSFYRCWIKSNAQPGQRKGAWHRVPSNVDLIWNLGWQCEETALLCNKLSFQSGNMIYTWRWHVLLLLRPLLFSTGVSWILVRPKPLKKHSSVKQEEDNSTP